MERNRVPYLIVPGWHGSGPDHWQSHWERELDAARRVEMPDWDLPTRAGWVRALDRAIRDAASPPILIAHSLGCLTVAFWAATSRRAVRGALLVAPPDLDRGDCPDAVREFARAPRDRLPMLARLIASDDDPYATLAYAQQLASDWGAGLTVLSRAGHINPDSGHGRWREGRAQLDELRGSIAAPRSSVAP